MSKMRIVAAQASVFAFVLLSGAAAFAQGTSLTVGVSAVPAPCVNDSSEVTVSYTVTSTGAADAATVGYSVDAGSVAALPTIASGMVSDGGGWTPGQGSKTATGVFTIPLSTGEWDIEVCAEQNGTEKKSDCSVVTVQVDCAESDVCGQTAIRGEIVGNKNLCKSDARVNVQIKGLFGPGAWLEVKNPAGLVLETPWTPRNGESCGYHWNLDPKSWSSAAPEPGIYTFKVIGNNDVVFPFTATLVCSTPGKK